jgi:hypothetical protein
MTMDNDIVCGTTAGSLEVTKDGQIFTASTGTMWTCRKGGVVLSRGLAWQACADDAPPLRHLRVNGVELSYSEQGSRAPVVFVPGAFSDLRIWEAQRQAVAQQYRFIADNQRYYGTAPWPDEGSTMRRRPMLPIWRPLFASSTPVRCSSWRTKQWLVNSLRADISERRLYDA